jgi:hypothetical protein
MRARLLALPRCGWHRRDSVHPNSAARDQAVGCRTCRRRSFNQQSLICGFRWELQPLTQKDTFWLSALPMSRWLVPIIAAVLAGTPMVGVPAQAGYSR